MSASVLGSLIDSGGRKIVKESLEKRISGVEEYILNKLDVEMTDKERQEWNYVKIERKVLKEMLDLPKKLVEAETAVKLGKDFSKEV